MVEETYHRQSVAAKALPHPRDQTGTRAGTGLLQGLQLLVPGMLAYKNSEAGHHPHMRGLQDMPLAVSCPLPCPGAKPATALKQGKDLDGTFLGALKGQGPLGRGTLPHRGQVKRQPDCLHQWEEEHQYLSGSRYLPEHQEMTLAGIKGCRIVLPSEAQGQTVQGQTELPQEQASLLAGEQGHQGQDLGQGHHTQPHEQPLPGAELPRLLRAGTASHLW